MPTETTPSPRVARKRQQKREAILTVAQDLLIREGLDAVTVHRVARELDLTVGALYRYFPSKDALLGALVRAVMSEYAEALSSTHEHCLMQPHRETPEVHLIATLWSLVLTYEHLATQWSNRFRVITLMLTDPRVLLPTEERQSAMRVAYGMLDQIEASLNALTDKGVFAPGPARDRAVMLWSSVHGVLQLKKIGQMDPIEIPASGLSARLTQTLFAAWSTDESWVVDAYRLANTWSQSFLPLLNR